MKAELKGRKWLAKWATMCREKVVEKAPELSDAMSRFTEFVRPLLRELREI